MLIIYIYCMACNIWSFGYFYGSFYIDTYSLKLIRSYLQSFWLKSFYGIYRTKECVEEIYGLVFD